MSISRTSLVVLLLGTIRLCAATSPVEQKVLIKDNPQVHFYFVSVWNSGEDGRGMLTKFGIADQPNVTILADPGPRGKDHIKQFIGLPLSWIPTTWVYKKGELRYALNYGEVRFSILQQFLADSQSEWSHKGEPQIE
jgi:hypothetical protein